MKRLFWRAGLFRACLGVERRWAQTQHIVVQLPARAAAAVVKKHLPKSWVLSHPCTRQQLGTAPCIPLPAAPEPGQGSEDPSSCPALSMPQPPPHLQSNSIPP